MFPLLKDEITRIIALFQKECYAENRLHPAELRTGRTVLKQMRQVAYLPQSIKTWLTSKNR